MQRRQLRIAPVMTGGTSLSVWMGGATVELYRMLRAVAVPEGGIYGRLLELTKTDPVVDVVTGTSAGGLNGTLLSAALNWGVSVEEFENLREVWMTESDLRLLLRTEDNPGPSLLDGNGTLVPRVEDLLTEWRHNYASRCGADAADAGSGGELVDLVTTFTTVYPRRRLLLDDFRERMDEQIFAGTIRHRPHEWGAESVPILAWGARVSSSIPGVFEPVYLPTTATAAAAVNQGRSAYLVPSFGERLKVCGQGVAPGVWAVDGGLINNLPLGEALDRIFEQSSEGEVRRVVLYVSPTPSALKNRGDLIASPPSVLTSILVAVNAPRVEGVGRDLGAIVEHNRTVFRQRAARSAIPRLFQLWELAAGAESVTSAPQSITQLPPSIMSTYRRRRAQESVDRTMARLESQLASREEPPDFDPAAWRLALLSARSDPAVLPTELPTAGAVAVGDWAWGISPIELAVSTTIGLLNRALVLPLPPGDNNCEAARSALSELKRHAHEVRAELDSWRELDASYWSQALSAMLRAPDLAAAAAERYAAWPGTDRAAAMMALWRLMRRVAELLVEARDPLFTILAELGALVGMGDTGPERVDLNGWASQLLADADDIRDEYHSVAAVPDVDLVTVALLASHVLQVVLLGEVSPREQPVELMQLSWNSPDYLRDSGRTVDSKVVGDEAARLGAFLFPAWRANDYLWGQLDAAPRLVELLLDPRRLYQLGLSPAQVRESLDVPAMAGPSDEIAVELAYLEPGSTKAIPVALPALTREVARRRQTEIARLGLGGVREALNDPRQVGITLTESARAFVAEYDAYSGDSGALPEGAVQPLLKTLLIGQETLLDYQNSALYAEYEARLLRNAGSIVSNIASPVPGLPLAGGMLSSAGRMKGWHARWRRWRQS